MNLASVQGLRELVRDHQVLDREAALVERVLEGVRSTPDRRKAVGRCRLLLGLVGSTLRSHFHLEEETLTGTSEGEGIAEEHRRIWVLAQEANEALPGAETAGGFAALRERMTELIRFLRGHFAREERDLYGILSSPGGQAPPAS